MAVKLTEPLFSFEMLAMAVKRLAIVCYVSF
jgi:hypothetical protein